MLDGSRIKVAKVRYAIAAAITFGLFAAVTQPAKSQSVPNLHQGMKISSASTVLKASGWQMKYAYPSCNNSGNGMKSEICRFHPNVEDCSSNGYCGYAWINREGKVLTLTRHGRYPRGLVNWRIN